MIKMPKTAQRDLEAKLTALNGPEWDSSDDEEAEQEIPQKKTVKKEKPRKSGGKKVAESKLEHKDSDASNVIYLGHIPAHFEEPELMGFLRQFGRVTRVHLSRSKKTANSRGYAFVEFEDKEVAAVVAETMSGYLLGQKRLVCHIIPKDKIYPDLFKGTDKVFRRVNWAAIHRAKVNRPKSMEKMKKITKRLVSRERKKRNKMKDLGIDYEFPGYDESDKNFPVKDQSEEDIDAADEENEEREELKSGRLSVKTKNARETANASESSANEGKNKRRKLSHDEDGGVPASGAEKKKLKKKKSRKSV
jgi:nucleolar protein 15